MDNIRWAQLFPVRFGTPHACACLALLRAGDAGRAEAEAFVHERFDHMHHADVHRFMPELVAMRDADGRLAAVAGMRLAAQEPLFLERYLDDPLEVPVARLAGRPVRRGELVEVGNLASPSAGSARLLIVAMTWLLAARGLEWVAFTGATSLLNSFHRLGLEPSVLAAADPARLGAERDGWGSYYEQHPQVFAGSIRHGHEQLLRRGIYQRLGLPSPLHEAEHVL
ncbi:Thermostable hemolysin [compost metagenome]